jgi:hypothetical protein
MQEAIRRSIEELDESSNAAKCDVATQATEPEPLSVSHELAQKIVQDLMSLDESSKDTTTAAEVIKRCVDTLKKEASEGESFASEAEGSGDVAAVLGETLDKVAQAIDDFSHELDRAGTPEDETSVMTEEEIVVESADGQAMDEWSVVSDDSEAKNDFQDDIAKATQALGSVMFSSAMSQENAPSLAPSEGNVSTLGSVPTVVDSIAPAETSVPQVLMQRWAYQLLQLHELGFTNDVLLVDTMERLSAANVGSGQDDEVTAQHVIDELMRD